MILLKKLILFYNSVLLFCGIEFVEAKISFQSPASSVLLTGTGAKLILNKSLDEFSGTLKISDVSVNSLVQSTSNAVINFTKTSLLKLGNFEANLYGSMVPDASFDKIYLDGNKTLNIYSGLVLPQVIVSGKGNVILGSPDFAQPIILADENAELSLGLDGKLTNDIDMNGGTVHLLSDLYFKDDTQLLGIGTVSVNNFSIFFPATMNVPLTGNITFNDANDVTVTTRTVLTGTWTFKGARSNLKGSGVIVDISGGGRINVNSPALFMNGIHLKGLGDNAGLIYMNTKSDDVFMTNVTLELTGNYTLRTGIFSIEGKDCKVVFHSGEQLIINSINATFTVDGQLLLYDPIGDPAQASPFVTTNGGTLSLLNGGRIQSSYAGSISNNMQNVGYLTSLTLTYTVPSSSGNNVANVGIDLGAGSSVTFQNPNISTPYVMVFDGQNNYVRFDDSATANFIVQQNVTLTVQNTKFLNFDPAKLNLQGSGATLAKIIFGSGVTFGIEKNLTISSNQLLCQGNTTFLGCGYPTLTLSSSGIVFSPTLTSTLWFRGLKLKCDSYNSLVSTSTVFCNTVLQNSDVLMTKTGMTFDTGNLIIQDNVNLYGSNESLAEGSSIFNFTTKGLLTVLGGSALYIQPDVTFMYSPDISADGGVAATQKRHIRMINPSSLIYLKRAVFNTGVTGLAFDYGKLLIDDLVTVQTSLTSGKEFELGSGVNTTILNNGLFNIIGLIKYMPTSYP